MSKFLLLFNPLGSTDITFFVVCALVVVLIVAVYLLIPVFNKSQYEQQRENLRKREESFKSNLHQTQAPSVQDDAISATQKDQSDEQ